MSKQLTILFYLTSLILTSGLQDCYPSIDSGISEFKALTFQQKSNQKTTNYRTWQKNNFPNTKEKIISSGIYKNSELREEQESEDYLCCIIKDHRNIYIIFFEEKEKKNEIILTVREILEKQDKNKNCYENIQVEMKEFKMVKFTKTGLPPINNFSDWKKNGSPIFKGGIFQYENFSLKELKNEKKDPDYFFCIKNQNFFTVVYLEQRRIKKKKIDFSAWKKCYENYFSFIPELESLQFKNNLKIHNIQEYIINKYPDILGNYRLVEIRTNLRFLGETLQKKKYFFCVKNEKFGDYSVVYIESLNKTLDDDGRFLKLMGYGLSEGFLRFGACLISLFVMFL